MLLALAHDSVESKVMSAVRDMRMQSQTSAVHSSSSRLSLSVTIKFRSSSSLPASRHEWTPRLLRAIHTNHLFENNNMLGAPSQSRDEVRFTETQTDSWVMITSPRKRTKSAFVIAGNRIKLHASRHAICCSGDTTPPCFSQRPSSNTLSFQKATTAISNNSMKIPTCAPLPDILRSKKKGRFSSSCSEPEKKKWSSELRHADALAPRQHNLTNTTHTHDEQQGGGVGLHGLPSQQFSPMGHFVAYMGVKQRQPDHYVKRMHGFTHKRRTLARVISETGEQHVGQAAWAGREAHSWISTSDGFRLHQS